MRHNPLVVMVALLPVLGCNLLQGYYHRPKHYRFATVTEEELPTPIERTVANLKTVLQDREISVKTVDQKAQTAQIRGTKDGLEYVFDIESLGEGSRVHFEINQAGNQHLAWSIIRELKALP